MKHGQASRVMTAAQSARQQTLDSALYPLPCLHLLQTRSPKGLCNYTGAQKNSMPHCDSFQQAGFPFTLTDRKYAYFHALHQRALLYSAIQAAHLVAILQTLWFVGLQWQGREAGKHLQAVQDCEEQSCNDCKVQQRHCAEASVPSPADCAQGRVCTVTGLLCHSIVVQAFDVHCKCML